MAALVLVATSAGAAERPPCGACLHAAVRLASWPDGADPGRIALVLGLSEMTDDRVAWLRAARAARVIVVELSGPETGDRASFATRRALSALRGANPSARLAVFGSADRVRLLLAGGIAAYLDIVIVPNATAEAATTWKQAHAGLQVWTTVSLTGFAQLMEASAAILTALDGALVWPPVVPTPDLTAGLEIFARVFPEGLVEWPDGPDRCAPPDACAVAAFERPETHARVVLLRRTGSGRGTTVLSAPGAEMYAIGSDRPSSQEVSDRFVALAPAVPDASGAILLVLPGSGASHLVASVPPPADVVAEQVSVVGTRQLSVEEIVARHQAQAARQAAILDALVTHARTTVTFEVPSFAAPVTVQARTEVHERRGVVEVLQRDIRVNGVAFSETSFPRLPIVEPERVAAPPLAITLTRAYRYRLTGRERVADRDAYVVAFDPADSRATLFRGRAWIDATTFGVVRLDAVQTNLRGPITSSQQIEEFAAEQVTGQTLWLLARSEIRQVYQGAGVTTPIHRLMVVERREINPPGLDARLRAAEHADALLLRDTGEGLHYVGRGRATRILTLAGGVLIDPNISRPLPFAGLNYSDFDFLGAGAQLNAFFGGAYGQFAFTLPSIAGSRWQLAGSGFAMLARYNDRAFRAGREHYEENLAQRPAHASVGIVRPLDPKTSGRVEYVFDYIALDRSDSTAAEFVLPADQVVHAARISIERQQWGWGLSGWWSPARRAGWHAWGMPSAMEYQSSDRAFQRFGVRASRPWMLGPRVLTRVELGLMSGTDLDRFSRYAFDSFENRLHGYPSASVRYDRGAILRTAIAAQPGGRLRLDGFADLAWVREPGFGRASRAYPGLGAGLEAPGPFGLLLAAEWGYGFNGLNSNGRRGTQVVRLIGYKLF